MGREFELKYRATPAQQAALREEYPGLTAISMETTYYDTPDGALGRLHWTLRRRLENGKSVCTVKTPAPGGGRGEWETEWDDIETAIPALCALGAPRQLLLLTAGGVTEVCGARFTRLAGKLELEACAVELALDSGCLLGGGRELPLCEIEVEHKAGSEEATRAFGLLLAKKYGLIHESKSKYRRALELAAGL